MPTTVDAIHQARLMAGQLLNDVLDERIVPQLAINRWPAYEELQDPSLKIAYQALWHFEADEEQQRSELFYMDAQLELLRQMAVYLGQGRSLPPYMMKLYPRERCVHFFQDLPFIDDVEHKVKRLWQAVRQIWEQAFALLPASSSPIKPRQKSLR